MENLIIFLVTKPEDKILYILLIALGILVFLTVLIMTYWGRKLIDILYFLLRAIVSFIFLSMPLLVWVYFLKNIYLILITLVIGVIIFLLRKYVNIEEINKTIVFSILIIYVIVSMFATKNEY